MLRRPASGSNRGRSLTARRRPTVGEHTQMTRICALPAVLGLAALTWAVPAHAQADMDGTWQPRYHEDQPERIPGPELRDYLGLADQRRRPAVRRQLGPRPHHPARGAVPRPRVALHLPGADQPADLGGEASQDAGRRSPSSTTTRPTSRRGPSTWTAGRTPARTPPTPGWAFRPAAGTATCSSSRRPTSSRGGCAGTACR